MASRGITAGSGFATAELKVLLQDTMEELHSRWAAKLTIKLFVDDLTISACGVPQAVGGSPHGQGAGLPHSPA